MTLEADTSVEEEHRIAVVFIHGQGQQRPMEDVQELARTVWEADPHRRQQHAKPKTWTVPDARLGLADIGRVTTEAGSRDLRVDFFELYWAHLMAGNRLEYFLEWFRSLQNRPRRDAPPGLLPVRQLVIRFSESIALLATLFTLLVAMLMPAPRDGIGPEQLTLSLPAPLGFAVALPTPADASAFFTAAAIVAVVAAWVVVLLNEVIGGAMPAPRRRATLLGLKAKALFDSIWMWPAIGVVLGVGLLIVHELLWQGPWLQWADLRLPLLMAAFFSALLLAFRRIEMAATIGGGAAAVALIGAIFGELNVNNLWDYGPNVSDWLNNGPRAWISTLGLREPMLATLYTIFAFAGLWTVLGANAHVGAQRRWWLRVFWTALTVAAAAIASHYMFSELYRPAIDQIPWAVYTGGVTLAVTTLIGVVLSIVASHAFLVPVMTDSARYFSRGPEHIDARQQIRKAGVELLDRLHDPAARYERIIVVAHSLGTAVGYELIADYWARQCGSYVIDQASDLDQAFHHVEQCAHALNGALNAEARAAALADYRGAQRRLSRALASRPPTKTSHGHAAGKTWLISDFITLGSPLTHSSLLLADHQEDLIRKQAERKLSTCPPTLFDEKGSVAAESGGLSFRGWDGRMRPMHSAVFAPVRWTNHFFRVGQWIIVGDVIGGPLATAGADAKPEERASGLMGPGVLDVAVDRLGTGQTFAHNAYWKSALETDDLARCLQERQEPQHIAALIDALDLRKDA